MNHLDANFPCPTEGSLMTLTADRHPALMALYRSLAKLPGSGWDDSYPDGAETLQDLSQGRVLGLVSPAGELLAAITLAEGDADFNGQPCWTNPGPTLVLVRLGVSLPLHHRGLGRWLFLQALARARALGAAGVRFMVDQNYSHAIRLYEGLGCTRVGAGRLYEMDWYFYEVNFSSANDTGRVLRQKGTDHGKQSH